MKNIFLTLQDALNQLPWSQEKKDQYWQFLVVLPTTDLEEVSIMMKKNQQSLLIEYRDTHPLWVAERFSLQEIQEGIQFVIVSSEPYRVAHTLYQLLDGTDYDLASNWLRASEIATKDTLKFGSLTRDPKAMEYHERVYTLLGWKYIFISPNWFHDMFWMGYYLIQGIRMGVQVENQLNEYLLDFHTIAIRHETLGEIQNLLEKNESILHGQDQKGGKTVKQWLELYKNFPSQSPDQEAKKKIDDFCAAQKNDYDTLTETNQYVIKSLLSIYHKLLAGEWEIPIDPNDFLESLWSIFSRGKDFDASSVEMLKPLFEQWYHKNMSAAEAKKKFILRFIDEIKIERIEEPLFVIDSWFKEMDPNHDEDLIYMDELDGKFHWNEKLL